MYKHYVATTARPDASPSPTVATSSRTENKAVVAPENTELAAEVIEVEKIDLVSLKAAEAKLHPLLVNKNVNNWHNHAALLIEIYALQQAWYGISTTEKAAKYLRITSENRDIPSLLGARAYWMITRGRSKRAIEHLKKNLQQHPDQAKMRHALGWALSDQRKYEEADKQLEIALRLQPKTPRFLLTRAENAYRSGDRVSSMRYLEQLLTIHTDPIAQAYLAALQAQTSSKLKRPCALLETLNQYEPANLGPRGQVLRLWATAEIALARGKLEAAQQSIQAVQSMVSFPPVWSTEARLHLVERHPKLAIEAYEQSLTLSPRYETLHWELARLEHTHNPRRGLAIVEQLRASHPNHAESSTFTLFFADNALHRQRWAQAEQYYRRAETLGAKAAAYLGFAKLEFAKDVQARRSARLRIIHRWIATALRENLEFPEAHDLAGHTLVWNFQLEEAQAAFEEAERWLKRLDRPLPQRLLWYDKVVKSLRKVRRRPQRERAKQLANDWEQRRATLLGTYSKETE
ncbi:MAG: tetratricopeptide repeat protein [Myxococcales bacterium]|nr:tetratricopeptide repeat protein [Myxococcales bacterium]